MPKGAVSVRLKSILSKPAPLTAEGPNPAKTAPTNPPTKACVELDGIFTYQAKTIQNTVELRAAQSIKVVIPAESTTSLPTAAATATPNNNGPTSWAKVDNNIAR